MLRYSIHRQAAGVRSLFNGSQPDQAWNTMDEALVPGTTMLWDGSSGFRKLQITPEAVMSAGLNSGAATGSGWEMKQKG